MLATMTLTFALTFAEAPKPAAPDKAALGKLQGKWQLTRHEHGGEALPAKKVAPLSLEVSGVRMTVRDRAETKEESDIVVLDPKGKPAAVDVKIVAGADRDKVVRGIWKLKGDKLTLCLAEPGKARPEEFAGNQGTGHTLLVFERVKKK